ncbi:MAG: pre-peptidase C-terminal domain-containing protein [Nostoc sp. S4]|nr:pre-peptidase C-terminal domain-containing protein [Nostoc sp. S4]
MALFNLGTLGSTPVIKNNFDLTTSEPTDVFQFKITNASNINLSLTDISTGDDADLRLYRDVNSNGILDAIDRASGFVAFSFKEGNADEAINAKANAGTYFAEVSRFALNSSGDVSYNLDLSATRPAYTADFSNLLPKEFNIGQLSTDVTRTDCVNDYNTADVYSFSLGLFQGVDIHLTRLSSDADIRLILDFDGDRIVDAGEEIARSVNAGSASELISNITLSGNYLLQVNQFSGNTAYALTFDQFTTPEA